MIVSIFAITALPRSWTDIKPRRRVFNFIASSRYDAYHYFLAYNHFF
jgi:hypothetical protein